MIWAPDSWSALELDPKFWSRLYFQNMEEAAPTDGSGTSANSDTLFDPSAEMLMNECDDERTLDEEEALAAAESEDPNAELSCLQRESDMPLGELLALYGYREMHDSESPVEEDYAPSEPMDDVESETDSSGHSPKLRSLYQRKFDSEQDSSRLLRSGLRLCDEEDEDFDYTPDEEEWRKVNKTIMVGNDYQAIIPDGLSNYDDALPYENEDKLLWDPTKLGKSTVEDFLRKVAALSKPPVQTSSQVGDDEQALYLLLQCGHNIEEALRRVRINVMPAQAMMSLWSEDECKNFESGIRSYGKSFHLIQQNKVRTRSIGELAQFYYLWKKSERHDFFGNKAKLEKKKYSIHPGLTDFMDRFLEDQDGRDRSSSPSVPYSTPDTNKKSSFNTLTLHPKPSADK